MPDVHGTEERSRNMAHVRARDTGPEMTVRRLVFALGFRYRLHGKTLPGKPDLVFRSKRKVIFVHGCFWHMHTCRAGRSTPKTNAEFWSLKRAANVTRDRRNLGLLQAAGWEVLTIWECELRKPDRVQGRAAAFLRENR